MMQLVEDFSAIIALLSLVSFHPHRSLWGRQDECYHAHFTDGETKAQKGNNLPTCKVGKVDSKNRKRIILLPVLWMTMKVLFITYEINAMTIALASHASEVMLKIFQARVSNNWIENFQMHKLGLEKAEKPKIKSPTSLDHRESKGIPKTHFLLFHQLRSEKAMAPHSSTLAWKIPWMEEPGRLQTMGSLGVRHDWATSISLFTFHFHALEKEMATHSSVLAWRIPGMGEPGGLPSMGLHRVGHDWSDLVASTTLKPLTTHHNELWKTLRER